MPQLYLYWEVQPETDRDEVEEVLSGVLAGQGEIIGAGSGLGIANLDVELVARHPDRSLLETLDTVVARLRLPAAFWQWERSADKHPVGSGLSGPA